MKKLPWDLRFLIGLFPAGDEAEIVVGDVLEEAFKSSETPSLTGGIAIRVHVLRSLASIWSGRGRQLRGRMSRGLRTDLSMSLRLLWRRPVLAAAVIGSIALGVGATATSLAFMEGVLATPFPYPEPEKLVRVTFRSEGEAEATGASFAQISALAEIPELVGVSPVGRVRMVVPGELGADRLRGEAIGPNYFDLLQPEIVVGRLPSSDSYGPGASSRIVLSEAIWDSRFGRRPDIVGHVIRSDEATHEIVGVVGEAFFGSIPEDKVDFWVPLRAWVEVETAGPERMLDNPEARWLRSIARVRGGGPPRAGKLLGSLPASLTGTRSATEVRIGPLTEEWLGAVRPGLRLVLAASVCLLLLACVNVAALMGARLLERRDEMGVRLALGASRAHVLRGLLTESLVLAGLGSLLGTGLAWVSAGPVAGLLLTDLDGWVSLPATLAPRLGPVTLLMVSGAAVVLGVFASLAPMMLVGKGLFSGILNRVRGVGAGLPTRLLNGAEIALATVLLLGTGLLLRSYDSLATVDPGFRTEGLMKIQVTAGGEAYQTLEARQALNREVLTALRAEPGIGAAALVAPVPPPFSPWQLEIAPGAGQDAAITADYHLVSDGFFELLEIPLLAGRSLDEAAHGSSAVTVVSRSLADRWGGPLSAVGRSVQLRGGPLGPEQVEIVGVVEDVLYTGTANRRPAPLDLYLTLRDRPSAFFAVLVQDDLNAAGAVASAARRQIGAIDPTAAVHWIEPLEQAMQVEMVGLGRRTTVIGLLAAVALLMAAIGLYGMLSYSNRRRQGEFAVRMALGAAPGRIAGLVFADGLFAVAGGLLAGLALSVVFVSVIQGFLYGVQPMDPATLIAVCAALALVGTLAAMGPARAAARMSVGVALNDGDG